MDDHRLNEVQSLLPDDVSPATVLGKNPPLLGEIDRAVSDHYRASAAARSPVRGLIIVLARRYTRETNVTLARQLGCNSATVASLINKTHGRLAVNELLRDDRDIIERRLADIVIERIGGGPCH